ncbi:2,3-bisphosphoglycerate-independent phosphoglycerate mutase [Candidatus Woesearchaeota archaeon]|nr:2,3-bisphosphoglycerate-independent phosphoglycerate mutase [Candidatus Woesearchaeota archaeon]
MGIKKKRKAILVIMDGWGIRKARSKNAVACAYTPVYDSLLKKYPHTTLSASGEDVGLPRGFIGNSEVGHLNIGAGRVVKEKIKEIDDSIKDRSFYSNKAFIKAIDNCRKHGSTLHLIGLIQMQGVHSMSTHLVALLKLCKKQGFSEVVIHGFTDGRDSPPRSARRQLKTVTDAIRKTGVGRFVTITGRYYAMDRDKRWKRTKRAYDCIMNSKGKAASSVNSAIHGAYARGESDEFISPTVIDGYRGIRDHDSIIMFNYRLDRARQLTMSLIDPGFKEFKTRKAKGIRFCSMTQYYKGEEKADADIAFQKEHNRNILGEWLSKKKIRQFRTAETEKYAHVTYFFNSQQEKPFPGETRKLVLSPKVSTYDKKPEMSAYKVRDNVTAAMNSGRYGFIAVNFANPDMVGHTGNFDAAKKAVETVDKCVGSVCSLAEKKGWAVLIIADHGNCEDMGGSSVTSHTTNRVPLIYLGPGISRKNTKLRKGRLADIAPTILQIMQVGKPAEMTGKSLVVKND